ncbi:unknown [Clostridium sp. CAG:594]|nr:unknown [Clostridium sp. CAG:594]
MKAKMHNQMKILNYISSTNKFKVIFMMMIILSLYGSIVLGISEENFIDSILIPFQFPIFNVFMFALLFFNTLNTCACFNKEFNFYIIRLKTKANYIKELCKTTLVLNVFYYILFFLFYFIVLNIFKMGNMNIHSYQNYSVNNLFYIIFYLLRYIIISLLVTIITTICYINFKEKITMFVSSIFIAGFIVMPLDVSVRSNFTIVPWNYFINVNYASFVTEISFSILFILILELIIFIIHHLTLANKRWVIS